LIGACNSRLSACLLHRLRQDAPGSENRSCHSKDRPGRAAESGGDGNRRALIIRSHRATGQRQDTQGQDEALHWTGCGTAPDALEGDRVCHSAAEPCGGLRGKHPRNGDNLPRLLLSAAGGRPAVRDVPTFPAGSGTVLLAADAPNLRKLASAVLRHAGYRVLEASHGAEAIDVSTRYQGPIHLLLTDVVMPRMHGAVTAQRISASRPDTRVLFMSGYADNIIEDLANFSRVRGSFRSHLLRVP
jgi:CheY-like chemotaxis protein